MKELPSRIIDAHHHLWNLDRLHYPWLMAKGVPRFFGDPTPIQKNYLIEDFLKDTANTPLVSSVHVQVGADESQALEETRWLQSVANQAARNTHGPVVPGAIIGYVDLALETLPETLSKHQQSSRFRGVRQILGRSHSEDTKSGTHFLLDNQQWRLGLKQLAEAKLSFDLQLIPEQMNKVVSILENIPELRVALCHCGSPVRRTPEGLAQWRQGIARLAELPNVTCKISGLGMYDHSWNLNSIRPYVVECIEAFSPQRCMFGSNFPVDKLYSSYNAVWAAFNALTQEYAESERNDMFFGSARRFYDIENLAN